MFKLRRKAFTLLEVTFVIVIIGILSAVAIPKLAATADDAEITSAINTVASVRNAIAVERQKRILRGDFTPINDLAQVTGTNEFIFDVFNVDNLGNRNPVLEYPLRACESGTARGCWMEIAGPLYRYRFPHNTTNVDFNITNNRFDCIATVSDEDCDLLTR